MGTPAIPPIILTPNTSPVASGAAQVGFNGGVQSSTVQRELLNEGSARYGFPLNEFYLPIRKKMHDIAYGIGAPLQGCIGTTLDSVSGYYQWAAFPWLRDTLGVAGYGGSPVSALGSNGTAGSSGLNFTPAGDVAVPGSGPLPYDYRYYPTGTYYDIGVGGSVVITVGGGVFTATNFAVFFAKINGAGTCQIDLLDSANAVVATIASFDTNSGGAPAFGLAEFVVTAAARKIRVTGLTGRCALVTAAMVNKAISGIVWFGLNRGGLGLDNVAQSAKAVWQGVVAYMKPDLTVFTARESPALIATYLANFVADWQTAWPANTWQFNGCWAWGGPSSGPTSDYGVNPPVAPSWLEQEEIRKVAEQFGFPFKNLYNITGVSTRKDDPADVHLAPREAARLANSWLQDFLGDFWFNVGYTAKRIFTALSRAARFEISVSGDPNVAPALWASSDAGNNDTTIHYVRKILFTGNANGVEVPMFQVGGSTGNLSLQFRGYTGNLNGFVSPSAFDLGDASWLVGIFGPGFYKNWRVSSSLVRERVSPGYSRALVGTGTPVKNFASTDTAFTTDSDYGTNESRTAWDATNKYMLERLIPAGGGNARGHIKPTVDSTKGLGTPLFPFLPTDQNFTDVSTYADGEVRDAIDRTTKVWTRKMNVGGTLFTWAMGMGV